MLEAGLNAITWDGVLLGLAIGATLTVVADTALGLILRAWAARDIEREQDAAPPIDGPQTDTTTRAECLRAYYAKDLAKGADASIVRTTLSPREVEELRQPQADNLERLRTDWTGGVSRWTDAQHARNRTLSERVTLAKAQAALCVQAAEAKADAEHLGAGVASPGPNVVHVASIAEAMARLSRYPSETVRVPASALMSSGPLIGFVCQVTPDGMSVDIRSRFGGAGLVLRDGESFSFTAPVALRSEIAPAPADLAGQTMQTVAGAGQYLGTYKGAPVYEVENLPPVVVPQPRDAAGHFVEAPEAPAGATYVVQPRDERGRFLPTRAKARRIASCAHHKV